MIVILGKTGLEDSEDESMKKPSINKQEFNDLDSNPLLTDLDFRDKKAKKLHKAELWFEKDAFKTLENEDDEDYELDRMIELYKKKGGHVLGDEKKVENPDEKKKRKRKDSENSDAGSNSDYDMEEMMKSNKKVKKIGGQDGFEIVSREGGKLPFDLGNFID